MTILAGLLILVAIDIVLLYLLNAYRTGLEEKGDGSERCIGWIEKRGFVRMRGTK